MWKVGIAGEDQKEMVMESLVELFKNCEDEKNFTLIRNDIIENMKKLEDHFNDETIKQTAHELIETVEDIKYKTKYIKTWK